MEVSADPSLIDALESIRRATNDHDLDALVACFAPDYQSEFPVHPDRAFHGLEQLRRNWMLIFGAVPTSTPSCSGMRRKAIPFGQSGNGRAHLLRVGRSCTAA